MPKTHMNPAFPLNPKPCSRLKARVWPLLFLSLAALSVSLPLHSADHTTWVHDRSDLPVDPQITWGTLDNGFRYAILPNSDPPQRVSLRLLVQAGSLHETDEQAGLAHFLEHMAFNGTQHFPPGEMIEYFQRLGMAFGADTNAFTSFNETVYQLELPQAEPQLLNDGLRLFRDYADRMLLDPIEIDKERGVILSEKKSRDSIRYRNFIAKYNFLLPETRFPKRLPIGREETIQKISRKDFLDYYQKWYTCDRMILVAVGHIDPENLAPLIEQHFGSMQAPQPQTAAPDWGKLTTPGLTAQLHTEPEATETTIALMTVQNLTEPVNNRAGRIDRLHRAVADGIVNRRLDILSKAKGSPFIKGQALAFDWLNTMRIGFIELDSQAEQWEAALSSAEQALRTALTHGFTQAEVDEIAAKLLKQYELEAKSISTRKSDALANQVINSLRDEKTFTTPEFDLQLAQEALAKLKPQTVQAVWQSLWDTKNIFIFVSGNIDLPDAKQHILSTYQASQAKPVAPPLETEDKAFAYSKLGEPSTIAERHEHDKLGITQIRFANNVRLNLKPTDFDKNQIGITVRFGSGRLSLPKNKPGLDILAQKTFVPGGLLAHSADEIERLFADKTLGVHFTVDDDAFVLSGQTTPEDLDTQLHLLCAYLLAPGYREEALRQAVKTFDSLYLSLEQTPEGVMQDKVKRFLASGDPRFGFPDKAVLMQYTLDDTRSWLEQALQSGYLEISLVGDFDRETALTLVQSTFSALPKRQAKKQPYTEARKIDFPDKPRAQSFSYSSTLPKAVSAVYWPTDDTWDIGRTRRLNLLARVLTERLRISIREEIGQAYSPYAVNVSSAVYPGYGQLYAIIAADPDKAQAIAKRVRALGRTLHDKGISPDELKRVLTPTLKHIEKAVRDNGYWLDIVLSRSQEQPQRLAWAQSMESDYAAITVPEINKLAEQYLKEDKAISVLILPQQDNTQPEASDKPLK